MFIMTVSNATQVLVLISLLGRVNISVFMIPEQLLCKAKEKLLEAKCAFVSNNDKGSYLMTVIVTTTLDSKTQ